MTEQETVVSTVETPVETPVEEAQKVTFDDRQKERVNEIVRDAMARAGAEARAEAARLKAELDAAKVPTADTETLLRLAQAEAEVSSLRKSREESAIKDALLPVASAKFLDAPLAMRIMADSIRVTDGKVTVINPDGTPRLNNAFEPMTVEELGAELANQKKYLARGEVKPGSGSTPNLGSFSTAPRLEDLFGPNSNGGAANRLCLKSPTEYRRLRQMAQAKGLI